MAAVFNEPPKFLGQQRRQGAENVRANKRIAIVVQSSH
jgi:hypothetical protein